MQNKLTESLEKYLLAIYEIVKVNKAARVKDVSDYLKIGGPSTSEAVKTLAQKGYVNYVPYGIITITDKGIEKAENKIKRHNIICDFLENVLMTDKNKINENADKIEYSLPDEVLDKFVQFLSFTTKCSCKRPKWMESCKHYISNGEMKDKCNTCMKNGASETCCGVRTF